MVNVQVHGRQKSEEEKKCNLGKPAFAFKAKICAFFENLNEDISFLEHRDFGETSFRSIFKYHQNLSMRFDFT